MKYVILPKITEEQRDRFIAAIRSDDNFYSKSPDLLEFLGWLYNGSTRTITRKGNAIDYLQKFVDKGHSDTFNRVHENEGTFIASSGYIAAVVLPPGSEAWDMTGAYLIKSNGDKWIAVQEIFQSRHSAEKQIVTVETLQELLTACQAHREEQKRMRAGRTRKNFFSSKVITNINAATMECISDDEALDLYKSASGHPMGFDTVYLETVLQFLLCTKSNEAEVYYSGINKPLFGRAANLYSVIMPYRPTWQRQAEAA